MLIVLEGIDGSGKGTQSQLLVNRLTQQGIPARLFSFPCYTETFFGHEVGKYLNGHFGSLSVVPVEFAAMLYAGDRFEKKAPLLAALGAGEVVVCDRYVPSNLAHQTAKLPKERQAAMLEWIARLEYTVYGLPKPDAVFFLDMPAEQSAKMVLTKQKRSYTDEKLDLHEAATGYLHAVAETFGLLARDEGWNIVPCLHSGELRSRESVSDEIYAAVASMVKSKV